MRAGEWLMWTPRCWPLWISWYIYEQASDSVHGASLLQCCPCVLLQKVEKPTNGIVVKDEQVEEAHSMLGQAADESAQNQHRRFALPLNDDIGKYQKMEKLSLGKAEAGDCNTTKNTLQLEADEIAQNRTGHSANPVDVNILKPQDLTDKDKLMLKNVREGRVGEVIKLVILGANVNAKHQGGSTSLHLAAVNGDLEMVKLLLDLKVDVYARDALGLTALHEAAGIGHTEMVVYLVERGAKLHARDEDGDTPFNLAEDLGHMETAQALNKLERGEDRSKILQVLKV